MDLYQLILLAAFEGIVGGVAVILSLTYVSFVRMEKNVRRARMFIMADRIQRFLGAFTLGFVVLALTFALSTFGSILPSAVFAGAFFFFLATIAYGILELFFIVRPRRKVRSPDSTSWSPSFGRKPMASLPDIGSAEDDPRAPSCSATGGEDGEPSGVGRNRGPARRCPRAAPTEGPRGSGIGRGRLERPHDRERHPWRGGPRDPRGDEHLDRAIRRQRLREHQDAWPESDHHGRARVECRGDAHSHRRRDAPDTHGQGDQHRRLEDRDGEGHPGDCGGPRLWDDPQG